MLLRRIKSQLNRIRNKGKKLHQTPLQAQIEQARRAYYAEDHQTAQKHLEDALSTCDTNASDVPNATMIDLQLSIVDLFITQRKLSQARTILDELYPQCEQHHQRTPLAYILCSLGLVEQYSGNIEKARTYYEQSREVAEEVNTDGALGRALGHLADIYLTEGNASYAVHLLQDAIPRLQHSGDRELIGTFQGILGRALIACGQWQEGIWALQSGLYMATALNHLAQIRSLHRLLGDEYARIHDYQSAKTQYQYIYRRLKTPLPQDTDSIEFLYKFAYVQFKVGETVHAQQLAQEAQQLAQDNGSNSLISNTTALVGITLSDTNTLAAKDYLYRAIPFLETQTNNPLYIEVLCILAQIEQQESNLQAAEEIYTKALESISEQPPEEAACIFAHFGNLMKEKKRYVEAIQNQQNAASLYHYAKQHDHCALANCELGQLYTTIGDGRLALRSYEDALVQLNYTTNQDIRGKILSTIADAYTDYGDITSADAFYRESITLAAQANNTIEEAVRRGNYGKLLALTNRVERGIIAINKSLTVLQAEKKTLEYANQEIHLGITHSMMGDHQAALQRYESAYRSLNKAGNICRLAKALIWQAKAFLATGQYEQARKDYEQALHIAKQERSIPLLIHSLLGLTDLAIQQGQLAQAEEFLEEATPLAKRLVMQRHMIALHAVWSQLYHQQGQTEVAQKQWELAAKLAQSLKLPQKAPDWVS